MLDILDDDYIYGQKLSFSTTNKSNFKISGDAEFGSSKAPLVSISTSRPANNGSILSIDKFRIKSDGRFLGELSLSTSTISKFTMKFEDGRQQVGKPLQSYGKLGCELTLPSLKANAEVDVVNGPLIQSSLLYTYGKLSVGGEILLNTHAEEKKSPPEISDLNIGFGYLGPDWLLTARTTELSENLRLSYYHNITSSFVLATLVDYRFKANVQKITIGSRYMYVLPPSSWT